MSEPLHDCPDCAVPPGRQHQPGCDVARCKRCGRQELSCDHIAPMTQWTGQWPGQLEIDEGLAMDLNDLILRGLRGALDWSINEERWQLAWHGTPTTKRQDTT